MGQNTSLEGVSPGRLLEQVREHLRVKHYSIRTEASYIEWIRRFIHFHGSEKIRRGL